MSHFSLSRIVLACWFAVLSVGASAQLSAFEDVEAAAEKGFFKEYLAGFWRGFADFGDPFALSGGVALDLRSYDAQGGPDRQDPFFYSLAAHSNARIYKFDVPFSLVVSARQAESSLPSFRELGEALGDNLRNGLEGRRDRLLRFGASPHYKWARLHLGHRSMTFSQFTLANLNFLGVGAELTPGQLDVGAMYGRLAQAEPIDLSLATPNLPIYRRTGWGAKAGYGGDDASVALILFGARDDIGSLDAIPAGASAPLPEQNLVAGLNAQRLFAERFRARLELAHSVVSPDLYAAEVSGGAPDFLFERRVGYEGKVAADVGVDYEGALFTAGLQYQRIDPGYRSFGAYFFNNDVQNILANTRFGLFDSKVNVALSGGVQNDNLDERKPATTRRLVYAADANYAGAEGFTAAANYSNNSSDIGYVLNQGLDSLNAVIITEDAGLSLGYRFGEPEGLQHGLTLTGNLQQVNDDVADRTRSAQTQLLLAGLTYSVAFGASGWTATARTNYTQNELAVGTINRVGFGAGVGKTFLDGKLSLAADLNQYLNRSTLTADGTNLQAQLRTGYRVTEQLGLELATRLLRTRKDGSDPFRELTSTLGLRYTFQYSPFAAGASAKTDDDGGGGG